MSIETVHVLGHEIWFGWLMIAALFATGAWPVVVARRQREAARAIFDRPIFADAHMNKAQWLSSGAAMIGVTLAGFGVWWGDALAGVLLAPDILHDGYIHLREAAATIVHGAPRTLEKDALDRWWHAFAASPAARRGSATSRRWRARTGAFCSSTCWSFHRRADWGATWRSGCGARSRARTGACSTSRSRWWTRAIWRRCANA